MHIILLLSKSIFLNSNLTLFTSQAYCFKLIYVGYGAWSSISGDEVWDDGNISDNQGWKQIGSGLRSGSPSSF